MVLHAMVWFGGGAHVARNGLVRRTADAWQLRGVEAVQWQCGVVVWRSCAGGGVAVQWCGVAMVWWCNW